MTHASGEIPARNDFVRIAIRRTAIVVTVKAALDADGIDMPYPTQVTPFHDQTEETDGQRGPQREGWPARPDETPPRPARIARPGSLSLSKEVNSALDRLLQGENAVLSEEDLTAAVNTLQARLDISDSEAQQLVDAVQSRFDAAVETLRQMVSELQDRLVSTLNSVQSAVSSAALWLFIASVLGLVASSIAGAAGTRVKRA